MILSPASLKTQRSQSPEFGQDRKNRPEGTHPRNHVVRSIYPVPHSLTISSPLRESIPAALNDGMRGASPRASLSILLASAFVSVFLPGGARSVSVQHLVSLDHVDSLDSLDTCVLPFEGIERSRGNRENRARSFRLHCPCGSGAKIGKNGRSRPFFPIFAPPGQARRRRPEVKTAHNTFVDGL